MHLNSQNYQNAPRTRNLRNNLEFQLRPEFKPPDLMSWYFSVFPNFLFLFKFSCVLFFLGFFYFSIFRNFIKNTKLNWRCKTGVYDWPSLLGSTVWYPTNIRTWSRFVLRFYFWQDGKKNNYELWCMHVDIRNGRTIQ